MQEIKQGRRKETIPNSLPHQMSGSRCLVLGQEVALEDGRYNQACYAEDICTSIFVTWEIPIPGKLKYEKI